MTEALSEPERLRLDYDQTTQVVRTLTDIRFKLLAFVPTIAGASVGLVSGTTSMPQILGIGCLGLVATLGIFFYELRNSQLYNAAVQRAKVLERRLGIPSAGGADGVGGVFAERPVRSLRLFGAIAVWQDHRGLALVYAAALAGWSYLVAWGILGVAGVPAAQGWGAAVGAVLGVVVLVEVGRLDARAGKGGDA